VQTNPLAITVHVHGKQEACSRHQGLMAADVRVVHERRLEDVSRKSQRRRTHSATLCTETMLHHTTHCHQRLFQAVLIPWVEDRLRKMCLFIQA